MQMKVAQERLRSRPGVGKDDRALDMRKQTATKLAMHQSLRRVRFRVRVREQIICVYMCFNADTRIMHRTFGEVMLYLSTPTSPAALSGDQAERKQH